MYSGLHGKTLKNDWLLRHQAYFNGKFVSADSNKTFEVKNPSSGKVAGVVPAMDATDLQKAISGASTAFNTWKKTTAKERGILLRRFYCLVEEHKEDLAIILSAESGKPLSEARGELAYGASFFEFYSEEAKRIHGEVLQPPVPNREMILLRQPIGVAGLITPWNFPNAMIARKAGAALASGCTCVVKPAEDTPLSALALAVLADQAGFPPGVFNVVTCERSEAANIGAALCRSPQVAGIYFTGSTAIGRLLYEQCAQGIKRVGLELGGNAPFIVFDSAHLETAVSALMAAKFRNAGQVAGLVKASVAAGARLVLGGERHPAGELFYEPTLLTEVRPGMPGVATEIFGPVVSIMKFDTEEEAITIANDCRSGLASYLFSQNVSQVFRVARAIDTGIIGVNEGMITCAEGAFGGVKESGIGREGSHHGIDDYTYIKYLCIGNTDK